MSVCARCCILSSSFSMLVNAFLLHSLFIIMIADTFRYPHLPSIINTFMIHIKYCTSWTTFNTLLCCSLPPLPLLMSLYAIHLLFCIGLYPVRMSGAFHHGSIFLALPFSLLRLAKNFDHFSTEFNLYLARHTQWNNATFFRTRKVRLAESVKLYQKLSILY